MHIETQNQYALMLSLWNQPGNWTFSLESNQKISKKKKNYQFKLETYNLLRH